MVALRRPASDRPKLEKVLPSVAVRAAAGDLELAAAAVRWLLRRPVRVPEGFTAMRTSQSGFLLPAALVLTAVEAPALHVLLALWDFGPAAHLAVIAINVYGLLWLAGDRRLMQESAHRLEDDALVLELGARFRGRIALGELRQVIRLEPGRKPSPEPLTRELTPHDAPNVHLCLRAPVTLSTYFQIPLRTQHLNLFLDDPDSFVAELVRRAGKPAER